MEKSNACEACGRTITHRGFCLPCNKKRRAEMLHGVRTEIKAEPAKKIICEHCGFNVYYEFSNCPECGEPRTKVMPVSDQDETTDDLTRKTPIPDQLVTFKFPFDVVRPVQQQMVNDVADAVRSGRHLVADAPTGLGKTAAVLHPAVEYAVANGKAVFFLTSRLSQHKAAIETLKLMKNTGNNFKAVDIVGKRHLCSHDVTDMDSGMFNNFCSAMIKDKRCSYYKNAYSNDLITERAGIMRVLSNSIPTTEESMKIASSRYCTYEMLMDAAKHADVVVGDYFHLFGMHEKFLKRMAKNLSDSIIIVDEAHNLSSRLRNHLSSRISERTCSLAAKEAQNFVEYEAKSIVTDIGKIVLSMSKKKMFNKNEMFVEREEFIDSIAAVGNYDRLIAQLTRVGEKVLEEKKISFVDRIAEFLNMWKREGIGYSRILSRREKEIILSFNCLDPSIMSREIVSGSNSTILMSGTLRPMEMHRDLLGLEEERTTMKSYASPFPKENRKNIIVRGITTKYTERTEDNLKRIANMTSLCIRAIRGNVAVFFPSYDMRDKICNNILTNKHIILEKSEMTKKQRDQVKEDMRAHSEKGAVLFGVMGGSFSEGIDLPGDLLNGVIIIGLPLERPDLSVESLINSYDERFQRGRDYGYNFPAMIKVMQAAGRCIRTEQDRGVIVFADERFLWTNYNKIFPRDWDFTVTDKPDAEVKKFFEK